MYVDQRKGKPQLYQFFSLQPLVNDLNSVGIMKGLSWSEMRSSYLFLCTDLALVFVREENRSRVETTWIPTELLQSKNGRVCYPCMPGHFFIPVVNTIMLKEFFYLVVSHISREVIFKCCERFIHRTERLKITSHVTVNHALKYLRRNSFLIWKVYLLLY